MIDEYFTYYYLNKLNISERMMGLKVGVISIVSLLLGIKTLQVVGQLILTDEYFDFIYSVPTYKIKL